MQKSHSLGSTWPIKDGKIITRGFTKREKGSSTSQRESLLKADAAERSTCACTRTLESEIGRLTLRAAEQAGKGLGCKRLDLKGRHYLREGKKSKKVGTISKLST